MDVVAHFITEMSSTISQEDILTFLRAIEEGTITVTPHHEPQDVYAGNVCYQASNEWEIVIFNDANEWDYIDCITAPDGRMIDFDELDSTMPELRIYRPSPEIAWKRYRYCSITVDVEFVNVTGIPVIEIVLK